jgi:DNA-binding transcriptional regulator WhiA
MNLEIKTQEQFFIIDGLKHRIKHIEKLIEHFTSVELIAVYVKERNDIIELLKRIESL